MRLERRAGERPEPLGAIFGGVLLMGAVLATLWLRLGWPRPLCPLREWTGLACLTCGSTRMAEAVLSGRLLEALSWNPLVFLALSGVGVWAIASGIRLTFGLPAWRIVLAPRERLALRILAVAALIAGWAYVIWRGV